MPRVSDRTLETSDTLAEHVHFTAKTVHLCVESSEPEVNLALESIEFTINARKTGVYLGIDLVDARIESRLKPIDPGPQPLKPSPHEPTQS